MPDAKGQRTHQIILYGATGFTGRLVAEYLLASAPPDLRWAIAGRNRAKLEAIRAELAGKDPRAEALPIIVADSGDREALNGMASATDVVCTTVGPYALHGTELVAACVASGTDYCDLTGEVHFIRRMMDAHHDEARARGARIVHCCGFDSIPSDLGTLMVTDTLLERGATPDEVRFYAGESKGGASGGTIATMLALLDEVRKDRSILRIIGHPYALNPEEMRKGPDGQDQRGVRWDAALGMWTGPFVMAAINTRVVRRSMALRGQPFGEGFRYSEVMSTGKGFKGWSRAATLTGGLAAFVVGTGIRPLRKMLEARLPSPGDGPDEETRERGFFVSRLIGTGRTERGETLTVRGKIVGTKDPGYGETAKMIGESALCLALDGDEIPAEGGILTPATALGQRLITRLRTAGMTFEVT